MAKLSVSLAQMNIVLGEVKRNTSQMEKWAIEAARRGSHLVVFPELWSTGYALDRGKELASVLNSGLFAQVSTIATQSKISIVGSMLEKRGHDNIANSAAWLGAPRVAPVAATDPTLTSTVSLRSGSRTVSVPLVASGRSVSIRVAVAASPSSTAIVGVPLPPVTSTVTSHGSLSSAPSLATTA